MATRVWRGVSLLDQRQVLVQDEVVAPQAVAVSWQMLTDATIRIDGTVALLTKGQQRLQATLLSPPEAHWVVEELNTESTERPAPGMRKLVGVLSKPLTQSRIAVALHIVSDRPPPRPVLRPLNDWPHDHPKQ